MSRHASMNRIQRFVRNRVSGAWVPVAETTRGRSKSGRAKSVSTYGAVGGVLSLLGLAPLALASPPAAAPCVVSACNVAVSATSHPLGGQVVSGRGSISQSGETTTIRQSSQNLFLDWLSFNVGSDETVNFVQPSASAIAVNEIFSTNGSQILGHLNANGEVWLVNPNGIVFGEGAQVNVGGLVASTLNNVTLSGDTASFSGNGAGSLVNEGTINAATGGSVALLGNHVSNQGTITAKLGSVALGAGTAVTLTFNGNSLVKMQVDQSTLNTLAENGGVIQADGGTVILSAGAKNALLASVVNNTGIIEARTVENHDGTIELLGGMTAGTVNVGGTLDASAPNGGNGGFIETNAAHVEIADDAKVTSLAATGKTGTWLIDPTDFTIAASGGDITGVALATELDSGNVTIQSSQGSAGTLGNIYVNASVTPAPTAATTLTLDAIGSILINDPIKSTASALNLSLNTAVTGNVTLAAALTLAGGNVNVGTYTSGTVTPSVGTMDVTAGTTTLTGTLSTGTLAISGGTLALDTATTIPTLSLTGGTLNGVGAISTGNLTWSNATLLGSLTLNSGGTGTLSGGETFGNGTTAGAGTFTNTGTITDNTPAGYYSLFMNKNSKFYNQGSYTVTGNPLGFYASDTTSLINNSGTFTANPGTGNTLTVHPTFTNTNTGTVNVSSGTLTLGTNGVAATHSGAFTVASGSTLDFIGGTQTITSTGSVSGAGTLEVDSGTLNYDGSYTLNSGIVITGGTANFTPTTGTMTPSSLTISGGTANFNTAISTPSVVLSGGTLNGAIGVNTNNLTWSGATLLGSLTLTSGGTGTLSGDEYFGNGTTAGAGTFTNTGTITDNTPAGYYSLYMSKNSTFYNQGSYTVTGNPAGFYATDATSSFNNSGTFTANPGTGNTLTVYPTFTNTNTGTVNVSSGTLTLGTNGGAATHSGAFTVASGSTLDFIGGTQTITSTGSVSGAGTLEVDGGTLNYDGSYTLNTGIVITGGTANFTPTTTGTMTPSSLTISGGTANFNTAVSTPSVALSGDGTLNGAGGVNTNNLTWNNATLLGSLTLNSGGTGTLSGYEFFGNGTTAGTFTNEGTITDNTPSGNYSLYMYANSTFYNQSSYTITGNPAGFYATDATSSFNNSGTFTANPGTGNTFTVYPTFTNTGTVNVSSGTLALGTNGGAATHSGAFTVASGSTLDFSGGTQTITSTGSVSGAGTLEVDGGTLNYDGSYTLNTGIVITGGTANFTPTTGTMTPTSLTISGGTANFNTAVSTPSVALSGDGTLNGAGGVNTNNLTWNNATLLGSLTLNSGGTGTLSGYEFFGNGTTAGTFTNTGTITDNTPTGNYSLYMYANSKFYNQGSYTITGNLAGFYATDATSSFNNSGTFTANPGTGNTLTVYPTFTNTNTGTVNVNSGTLTLTDGLTQSGTINVAKSSVFSEAAGFTNTGTLAGSGKIVVGTGTSKLINEGNIDPGGTGVAGTLTITGAVQLSTGSDLNMELGGTAAGQFDVLSVSGALSGNASSFGALTLSEINGYVPTVLSGTSFQLVKAGSGASSTAFAPFHLARTTSSATYAATNITVNVAPDVLTVTPTSGQSTVYGTTDPTFTFTATGFDPTTSDDTANSLSGLLARAAGSNAGTYGINQGTLVSTDGYLISFTSGVNFSITPATLTVSGLSGTNRTYNGSVIDAFSGTAVLNGLVGTDTLTLGNAANGTLASANAGSEAIATGLTISNGTGLASNYTLVQPTLSNVTIAQAPLTITGLSGTGRIYDGTVVDALSGTAVLNGLVGSETLTMSNTGSGTLASKNAGSEAVATNVTLSNGTGLASNYVLTQPTLGNVTITPAALTISAVSDSKTYDGTTNSSQTPTVTAGTVFTGDSLSALTQSFASKNVLGQNGSTLNVNSITLNDGNGGNNYTVTVDSATGTITPASLVINAVSATKTYDATTNSTGIPTVTGTVFSGDTLSALTESFASKNVLGTNSSTLNVNSYTLSDGNNGSNYNVTVNSATGTITPLASVAWVGGATGNWSTASNWAGGIIPDLSNVSAVTIPAGKTVTYDSGVGGTTLLTTLTDSGNLIMAAGNLSTTGNLSTAGFQQTGGTLDVGGTLTIKSTSGGVTLGDMTAGILSVTSKAGAITQLASTAVAATGATTLTADNGLSGGNALYYGITLADAGNHFGGAVTSTGSNIDLMQGTGGLILGATTANGTLTVDSLAGAITQAASKSVIVTGASSLTADNGLSGGSDVKYGITLANTTNNFGGTVSADGLAISLLDDGTSGLTLGNVTAGGALTVTSRAGALTQAATAVAATGATTLTADNGLSGGNALYYGITLADAGNHFGGAVTSTGSNIDLMQGTGGLILGATTANGTLTVDSLAGAITQAASKSVIVTGASSLTADNGLSGGSDVKYGITLANTTNNFGGTVSADGLAISLLDDGTSGLTLGNVTAGGALTVTSRAGALTQAASTAVAATGATKLTADNGLSGGSALYYGITLADAGNHFGGAVTSTGSNIDLMQSTGGLILGATTATGTFTADSTAGAITQSASTAVNATGATSLTANNGGAVNYAITLGQANNNFLGGVTADGSAITLKDAAALTAVLDSSGASTLTSVGAMTVSGTVGSTLKTTTTGTNAATTFGATTVHTSLNVTSTGAVTETSSNILTVAGNVTTTAPNSNVCVNGTCNVEIPAP